VTHAARLSTARKFSDYGILAVADISGIDSGLTLKSMTSGVCRTGTGGFALGHTYIDKLSRMMLLSPVNRFDCLAVDAPVLPKGVLHYIPRPVESLFMCGAFQKRCKPGASHVAGTGQALRRAGCDAAVQFEVETAATTLVSYPRIQQGQNIIEAFPNAFLGVMLSSGAIDDAAAGRGEKTDTFFAMCVQTGAFLALEKQLTWSDPPFWASFPMTTHHDDLAALVCAATAACAYSGKYVAVGEPSGGYFFFPPWSLWQEWARTALVQERRRAEFGVVRVWIDGREFDVASSLPE
jgi:hypothetical protein